jgi:hypothetical protein
VKQTSGAQRDQPSDVPTSRNRHLARVVYSLLLAPDTTAAAAPSQAA